MAPETKLHAKRIYLQKNDLTVIQVKSPEEHQLFICSQHWLTDWLTGSAYCQFSLSQSISDYNWSSCSRQLLHTFVNLRVIQWLRSSIKYWIIYWWVHVTFYQSDGTNASVTCFFLYTWMRQICYCNKEPTSFSSPTPSTSTTGPVTRIRMNHGHTQMWTCHHIKHRLRQFQHYKRETAG